MRHKLLAILTLVLAAVLFSPLEKRIHAERVRMKYGGTQVSLSLREKLGQGTAVALLAGFRGVVADFLWIQNAGYFEKKEWLPMYRNIELVTTLQPQATMFWETGAWHMAWNIAYSVSKDPKNENEAQGIQREREWHQKARDFLLRGIENIPNRDELFFTLGWLYTRKLAKDCGEDADCVRAAYCKAAEYYGRAAGFPKAPTYNGREYARALEKCGRVRDAYEYWKKLWHMDRATQGQVWSDIERNIKRLEDELAIPEAKRVPRNPDGSLQVPL
jgi:tetratricopeptide (TPR) repeat protein